MRKISFILGISLTIICSLLFYSQQVHAEVEWKAIKELRLEVTPLDIVSSADGQLVFILSQGEILVYSVSEDKVLNRIPIDKNFDRLSYSATNNTLILTSGSEKILKIIQLEIIQKISIEGLPFKGPENAPVTIAVFSDYQ